MLQFPGAIAAVAALSPAAASEDAKPHWIAINADRNSELEACGGESMDFSLCEKHLVCGQPTGIDACNALGESCLKVMDWQCKEYSCTDTSEGSRATQCDGVPAPPTPSPSPTPPPGPPAGVPTGHACLPGQPGADLPFCNVSLPMPERVRDLVSRMDTATKARYLGDGATVGGGGAPELGLSDYSWNTEALHGLGGDCLLAPDGSGFLCPTVFPAPPGLGAAFNLSLAHGIGVTIGDEARAMNNFNGCLHRGSGGCGWDNGNWYIGLNVWVPNLNIYRDPRWGRNVEVPSEDPYHSGQYGAALVRGVQEGEDDRFTKISASVKHFGMYSVEDGRNRKNFWISDYDLEDTYFPSFEAVIREGKAQGYMCSYAAVNGVPSCGSKLLSGKARDEWGMQGYVQTDCGAIDGMVHDELHYASDIKDASAKALVDGGVDIDCGDGFPQGIADALADGTVSMADVDASLERSLGLLFRAGMFDPLEDQPYTKIPFSKIGLAARNGEALDAARQAMVLLKNDPSSTERDRAVLPLRPGLRILVVGPHSESRKELAGNYFEQICPPNNLSCVPTIKESLALADPTAQVSAVAGCSDTDCSDTGGIDAAVAAVAEADVVIMALGLRDAAGEIGGEGEGADRPDIRLPAGQRKLAGAVAAAAGDRPVVAVLVSGGLLAVEDLKASASVPAIVQCFYPGVVGAAALAEGLFGLHNRWSKLPFTHYAYNYTQSIEMDDMNMTDGVGRSYKYLSDSSLALWPFGWGLSYTTFRLERSAMAPLTVSLSSLRSRRQHPLAHLEPLATTSVTVTNTGPVAGDEVVFMFRTAPAALGEPQPSKVLIGFERVTLAPGESKVVTFQISARTLSDVNGKGTRLVRAGRHTLSFSRNGLESDAKQHVHVEGDAFVLATLLAAESGEMFV